MKSWQLKQNAKRAPDGETQFTSKTNLSNKKLLSIRNYRSNHHCRTRMPLTLILSLILALSLFVQISCHENVIGDNENIDNALKPSRVLELIRDWTLELGRDISSGTEETTCIRSLLSQYDPNDSENIRPHSYKPSIESIDWTSQHKSIVKTISNTMLWHQNAVEAIRDKAEEFSYSHEFNKNATIDYYDVHKIENLDDFQETSTQEQQFPQAPSENQEITSSSSSSSSAPSDENQVSGNENFPETLPKPSEQVSGLTITSANDQVDQNKGSQAQSASITNQRLRLVKHKNFGQVAINTEVSAVHTPVHIYPGDPQIMNDIIWSERLTQTFQDNFVRNPKLTNQFFASQAGFLRLFPAQKWQVKHDDPDLYDARMRPWYVAGASSRKDVVILVDSSGSMTGSRRDIARGVALEILDTLTDNDRFVVLKFSDSIQQVGVPGCPAMSPKNNTANASSTHAERKSKHYLPPQNKLPPNLNIDHSNVNLNSIIDGNQSGSGKVFKLSDNETIEVDSFYLLPANKRNVRHIKTNFNIPTSGIANFSRALVTAFEVLRNYAGEDDDSDDSQGLCNQAIMLITDGSPSDFGDIFQQYNYPNIPVRVFTYLIGREAGDITHTRMMACRNKGYYTHVINLAEVREAVQQYIPVMARPLVLNKTHPITWTPAYGELTYQILTDWIWESKRREKMRLASSKQNQLADQSTTLSNDNPNQGDNSNQLDYSGYDAMISDEALAAIDLFGYQKDRNCFWQTHQNDLLTTVVQPVYDVKNQSLIIEKFLLKNTWQTKESMMRTAKLLGVAAADMKINDIVALAPSHKLGPNAYTIMLTNNGFAMHHPDLRSILEPFDMSDPIERSMQVLKPFFSTIDFSQVEHVLNEASDDEMLLKLRKEAVAGLNGFRQLQTKRAIDCQRRPQLRNQSFYYEPLKIFPFSFITAVPQPYGSHHIRAQVELKSLSNLPEKVSNYLIESSDSELWTIHPDYQYCEGPANNSVTSILDLLNRIDSNKLDDIQWKASESTNPPQTLHHKLVCDKDLVQSLVYDAIATYGFSEKCILPSQNVKSSLIETYSVRFAFVATRSGLTRVRLFNTTDSRLKEELLSFAKFHNRAIDETFYSRTVDFNMLVNSSSVLIQVPFNTHAKIAEQFSLLAKTEEIAREAQLASSGQSSYDSTTSSDSAPAGDPNSASDLSRLAKRFASNGHVSGTFESNWLKSISLMDKLELLVNRSVHAIATQAIIVNEGPQRAVAGVTGVFYDYASFALRFFKLINRFVKSAETSNSDYETNSGSKHKSSNAELYCGNVDDTIDCLLLDNNGFIIVSEDLELIGKSLGEFNEEILRILTIGGLYKQINITDYQAVCIRSEEKANTNSSGSSSSSNSPSSSSTSTMKLSMISISVPNIILLIARNFVTSITTVWTIILALSGQLATLGSSSSNLANASSLPLSTSSLTPIKTYLRPCEQILTLYELTPTATAAGSESAGAGKRIELGSETYCNDPLRVHCKGWLIYELVPNTNLVMIIIDSGRKRDGSNDHCNLKCSSFDQDSSNVIGGDTTSSGDETQKDKKVCKAFEREHGLYKKTLDSCISKHIDEAEITLCGGTSKLIGPPSAMILLLASISIIVASTINKRLYEVMDL